MALNANELLSATTKAAAKRFFPTSVQPKAKQALHVIWRMGTKATAAQAFGVFLETY